MILQSIICFTRDMHVHVHVYMYEGMLIYVEFVLIVYSFPYEFINVYN